MRHKETASLRSALDVGENATAAVCMGDGVITGAVCVGDGVVPRAIPGVVVQTSCDIDPPENENISSLLALE